MKQPGKETGFSFSLDKVVDGDRIDLYREEGGYP